MPHPTLLACCLLACLTSACQRAPDADRTAQPPQADAQTTEKTAETAPAADPSTAEGRIEIDVRALADDAMQGRETGTPGYDKAADYVARRYQEIGLQPAGDEGSWFQAVPLLQATAKAEAAQLVVVHPDRDVALRVKDQFLPMPSFDHASAQVDAPAVFIGFGVHAPRLKHDDYAGIDLKGKIAVLFSGAPERFDNDRRAFYGSSAEKLAEISRRGAVGAVFVNTGEDEARFPWARYQENFGKPGMRLRDSDGTGIDTFPQLQVMATVSAAAADLIFDGSGHLSSELLKQVKAGTLKPFQLPSRLKLGAASTISKLDSRNVVARLPGSDPVLGKENVVYSAHLDHIGIGAPVNGDAINNGALDNALGVAIMLEAAHQLHAMEQAPKRSQLFVAVTAEEKGLLGARWFARHPTVPVDSMVANINMDMPVLLAPSKDIVPIGVEHSSLKGVLDQAAKDVGVDQSPDPFPEEAVFVRSDQYAFIRAGVPAVYLAGGVVSADGKRMPELAFRKFLREHYHRPSDQADLPIAYGDAARMARLNVRIGELIGNAEQRPRWNKGDFFGDMFSKR